MATEALNIRIDSELKQKLDNESERTGLTKTKILEGILKDYFAGSDNQLPTSNNINVDNSDSENLEARIARIEDALFGNDKNIPDRAEKAFDNYAGLEDSLNDLWEEHSQQRQQIRVLKDGFNGLSCDLNHDQHEHQSLSQTQLASRWGVNRSTVTRAVKKSKEEWENYCKKKDPDGLIWELRGNRYFVKTSYDEGVTL